MTKLTEELQQIAFHIILYAGNARSYAMEAIQLSKEGKFAEAREKIEIAEKEFVKAHKSQTELLQEEASGKSHQLPIILVHAQDHLMTSMTMRDLAKEMIEMYERIHSLEEGEG